MDVKEEPLDEELDIEDSLSTLANVTLATAGHLNEPRLNEEITRARENLKPILNQTESKTTTKSLRKVELTLPENTTHIVICTSDKLNTSTNNNNIAIGVTNKFTSESKPLTKKVKNNDYKCAECGKKYSTSSNLARHRQTHR